MTARIGILRSRGTDLVLAALECGPSWFSLSEVGPIYRRLRLARGSDLSKISWQAGMRNEVQELSSDASTFREKFDLFARHPFTKGLWQIRENILPKLVVAREQLGSGQTTNLIIPEEYIWKSSKNSFINHSHAIGNWAQKKIMEFVQKEGCTIVMDTSSIRAFDFEFREPGRRGTVQIMECKGTKYGDQIASFTENELDIMFREKDRYWLGHVSNIEIENGTPSGGEINITRPPVIDRWKFIGSMRMQLRQT